MNIDRKEPQMPDKPAPNTAWRRLLDIHQDLFGAKDPRAGMLRETPKDIGGACFARPDLIIASLGPAFASLPPLEELRAADRATFLAILAGHLAALYAIQPFDTGNRRVFAAYATELAQSLGHSITPCALDKTVWEDALTHAFINLDHRGIAAILSGAPLPVDYAITAALGSDGIPAFPKRDAPAMRRYLMSLAKARREVQHHLPDARIQALERLERLTASDAAPEQISAAQQELGLLRHARGPMFQLGILEQIGIDRIEPCIHVGQSALERVREITAAIAIGMNQRPRAVIERAARQLNPAAHSPGASPHQDRLAAEFLANNAAANRADPRFAAAQSAVDRAAAAAAADATRDGDAITAAALIAKNEMAQKIRLGGLPPPLMLDEAGTIIAARRAPKTTRSTAGTRAA
jgi:fido (protein-threonine AMPylation protein)